MAASIGLMAVSIGLMAALIGLMVTQRRWRDALAHLVASVVQDDVDGRDETNRVQRRNSRRRRGLGTLATLSLPKLRRRIPS